MKGLNRESRFYSLLFNDEGAWKVVKIRPLKKVKSNNRGGGFSLGD